MMDTLLNRQCLEVLHAKTVKDFVRISGEVAQSMGFHTMAALVVTDHSPHLSEFQSVTNAPADWMPTFEDSTLTKLDPVTQHLKNSSLPIIWDQGTYVAAGRPDFWEQQAPFGYLSGIGVGFHLPNGRHFAFGFDSGERACVSRRQRLGLTLDFVTFASFAQASAFELCLQYDPPSEQLTAPSKSELEALRWSIDGMTDWEIGSKLNVSERDVTLKLHRLMKKLGCRTKYEAGIAAIKRGLIGVV